MKKNKPKISVIMPFYNAESFLSQSIESVLGQTFADFEFIIINDASTDKSDEIVKKYLNDPRIVYIHNKKNKKITFNLNKGLDLAKADIVARMDGDDICRKDRFQKQYSFLEKNKNISLVGSCATFIDENGKFLANKMKPLTHKEIKKDSFVYSPFIHPAVMFRKKIALSLGKYNEKYSWGQDYALWLKWLASDNETANLDEKLIQYRIHANSSSKYSNKLARITFDIRKESLQKGWSKYTFKNIFFMYAHFFLGIMLSGKRKQSLEQWYKKIFIESDLLGLKKYWAGALFLIMAFLSLMFLIKQNGLWVYVDAIFLLKNKGYFWGYVEHAQLFERGTSAFGYDSSFLVSRMISVELADTLRFVAGYDWGVIWLYFIFMAVNFFATRSLLNYFFPKKISFFGGIFFAFNSLALFFLNKPGFLFAYSALPIVLLSFVKYFINNGLNKWIWIINSVLGFYFLISYPRVTGIYGIFFIILAIVFRGELIDILKNKKKKLLLFIIFHGLLFLPVVFPIAFHYLGETIHSTSVANYAQTSEIFSNNLYNEILKDNFFQSYFLTEVSDNFALLFQRSSMFQIFSLFFMLGLIILSLYSLRERARWILSMERRAILALSMLVLLILSISILSLARFVSQDLFRKIVYSFFPFIAGNVHWIYLLFVVPVTYLVSWVAFCQRKFFKFVFIGTIIYCAFSIWPLVDYSENSKLKTISLGDVPEVYRDNFYDKTQYRTRPTLFFPSDQTNNNLIFNWSPYPIDVTFNDPYKPIFSNNSRISSSRQGLFYNELGKIDNSIHNAYIFNLEDVFVFKDIKNNNEGYDFFPRKNYKQLSSDYYEKMKREDSFRLKEDNDNLAHFILENFSQTDFFIYSPKSILEISLDDFFKQDKIDVKRRVVLLDNKVLDNPESLKSKIFSQDVKILSKYSVGNTTKYLIKIENIEKNKPFLIQLNQNFGVSWKIKWVDKDYFEKRKCLGNWESFSFSNNALCLSNYNLLDIEDVSLLFAEGVGEKNHFEGNFFGNGWMVESQNIPLDLQSKKELYAVIVYEKQIYYMLTLMVAGITVVILIILSAQEFVRRKFFK